MLLISKSRATALVLAACLTGCVSVPWKNEPVGNEVNLSFILKNNLVFLSDVRVDNRPARCIFGSAHVHTVTDPRLGPARTLNFGEAKSVPIQPVVIDLRNVADAIVGADIAGHDAVTIDYHAGLVTLQKEGIHPGLMTLFQYRDEPSVVVTVDGHETTAVVDTSIPDTLVLPRTTPGRGTAHLVLAGIDYGTIDVQYANVTHARLGNRVLSKFLVSIDYGKRVVGLWRDPRTR